MKKQDDYCCTEDDVARLKYNVEKYMPKLTQVARALVFKWNDISDLLAEDREQAASILFNDAYVAAASTIHNLDPASEHFPGWFTKIMLHLLQEKAREKKRRKSNFFEVETFTQYVEEHPPSTNEDGTTRDPLDLLFPLPWVEEEQHIIEHDVVRQLLASLSPQDREIIELRSRGYSASDIAQMLHWLSSNKVALRIYRIVKRLRSTYCSSIGERG